MESQEYRRIMRLLPGDEKRMALAEKGILFLEEIDESSSYLVTLDFLYKYLCGINSLVWVILKSPGGKVEDGFAIYDVIKALRETKRTVNILGIGRVASMATAIMQAGTKRYSWPNTQFLIHQVREAPSFFNQGQEVNEGRERQEEMDRINDIVMGIIANRTGIDLTQLKKLSEKKDYWLDAERAKVFGLYGLVDEIITGFPF